jgi:hypothetical protein
MLTRKKLEALKNAVSAFEILDAEKKQRVVFTTQNDNRVTDKICLGLSGVEFDIDDPLRPLIPQETHPRCRCYYTDKETGQVLTSISSRRIGHRNKLTDRQRKNQNKRDRQYLTDKKIDMIVEQIEKHEKWEAKPKKKTNRKKRKANYEQIIKWLDMI